MRWSLLILCLTACAGRARVRELEERLEVAEARLRFVSDMLDLPSDPERENQANLLATEAQAAMDAMDLEKARDLVARLATEYGDTSIGRAAAEVLPQLSLIGSPAGEFKPAGWVRGEMAVNPARTTVVVFFEAWCPHCQREVPNVQAAWTRLRDRGLDVVGVTSFSRDTTPEQMAEFLDSAGVGFPVARDDGSLSERYAAQGVPHAAVLRGGKIAWIGHPASLEDGALEKLLPSP
jgi:peroxiredoxin